jgi:hypothetical protein
LDDVTLLVDGNPQSFTEDWQVNPMGHIDLTWDISRLQAGDMELVVQVTDELGYQGSSRPVLVEVKIDRPLPPTPVPTTEPEKPSPQPIPTSGLRWELIVGFILLLVLVFSLLFWRRRRAAAKNAENADKRLGVSAAGEGAGGSTGESMMIAALEPLNDQAHELIALDGENITIGSEVQSVQLLLLDESVGRLHARIRRQGHNNYWLFDEGSADGTYLNYERLGLAPRELTDGDTLQFGKVGFRFRLRPSAELEE